MRVPLLPGKDHAAFERQREGNGRGSDFDEIGLATLQLKQAVQPAFVLNISDYWEQKIASIRCYASQFIDGRPADPPTFLDQLRDEAAWWGKTIGVRHGEPFSCREPIGLSTMAGLV